MWFCFVTIYSSGIYEHKLSSLSLSLHFRGDAPIIGHLLEYCSAAEYEIGYSSEGHCHGFNELQKFPPRPRKMTWELPDLVSNELLYTYIRIFDMF